MKHQGICYFDERSPKKWESNQNEVFPELEVINPLLRLKLAKVVNRILLLLRLSLVNALLYIVYAYAEDTQIQRT